MSHRWQCTYQLHKQASETRNRNWFSHFAVDRCALERKTRLIAVSHRFTTGRRWLGCCKLYDTEVGYASCQRVHIKASFNANTRARGGLYATVSQQVIMSVNSPISVAVSCSRVRKECLFASAKVLNYTLPQHSHIQVCVTIKCWLTWLILLSILYIYIKLIIYQSLNFVTYTEIWTVTCMERQISCMRKKLLLILLIFAILPSCNWHSVGACSS